MAGNLSAYARTNLIKALLKNTAFTGPATLYVSLHTADPTTTGANEVVGNGYARVSVAQGAEAGGVVSSSAVYTSPLPTPANWGTVTHVGYWDALINGNFLLGLPLTASIATSINVAITVASGSLTATMT